jgi:hypothetical protein
MSDTEIDEGNLREQISDIIDEELEREQEEEEVVRDTPERPKNAKKTKKKLSAEHLEKMRNGKKNGWRKRKKKNWRRQ